MCPLRIILIFLSATLAGFFVLRGLKSQPGISDDNRDQQSDVDSSSSSFFKAKSAVCCGFWTCVDMASGRYLWRHLVSERKRQQ